MELSRLESKSLTDLGEESLRAQDTTRDSQFDFTHQVREADETCVSTVSSSQFSVEDDGISSSDTTQLATSLLDEGQRSLSEAELQPEDQDEELEMSLRSHGSSLVELYPGMISRLGRAWHRQQVSEAAGSVLRRYRRWRQQPSRGYINNTFIVPLRHNSTKKMNKTRLKENSDSSMKIQHMETDTTPQAASQTVTSLQDWQAQQQSPGRVRASLAKEQHQPIFVIDLSGSPDSSKPKEVSLNKTFNVSQLGEQLSTNAVSSSRPFCPTAKASLDQPLRAKRLSLTAHSLQTSAIKERPDIYGSPVRQSPLKVRMTSFSRSPHASSRSPKTHSVESFSREPLRSRLTSTSLHSPPAVPLRVLNHQDARHSFQLPQLPSPSATAAGRPRLRRHLSFDSSLPSNRVSSPKKLDEEFLKLYHRFVCQSKSSSFNGPPCRLCETRFETSKGHSSSALAALALSPHRSLLRKRHRELSWNNHPRSKRPRDDYCTSSPGSKWHGNEMLSRRLSLSEYEQSHDGLCFSPSKHSMFQRFSSQQHSADAHQETLMSRGCDVSVGASLENRMANSISPRKWW
ncbi:uncharacterized protein [Chaetodon trifascialis]|uniref:uncharacterized protein n=1 Tax=Chaetodon trifascialis TaxID=109706 RepID=UPI003992A88C